MVWFVVWTLGWPMWVAYWAYLVSFMSDEISERMVTVSKWMIGLGYIGALITAFWLPYVDLPWIVRS